MSNRDNLSIEISAPMPNSRMRVTAQPFIHTDTVYESDWVSGPPPADTINAGGVELHIKQLTPEEEAEKKRLMDELHLKLLANAEIVARAKREREQADRQATREYYAACAQVGARAAATNGN